MRRYGYPIFGPLDGVPISRALHDGLRQGSLYGRMSQTSMKLMRLVFIIILFLDPISA